MTGPPTPPRHCLVCDRPSPFAFVYARGGYTLVRCPGCGLHFQDPQPPEAALAGSYYHDPVFTTALMGEFREWTLSQAREKVRVLEGIAGPRAPGRALDVGCSSGAWLEVISQRGWSATGIEPGASTVRAARDRGLDVREGTLESLAGSLSGQRFELITYWDVLEHLRDPRHELELAAGLLAPGGVLAASMPNVMGLYPRVTRRLLAPTTGVWEYPELPLHLFDFSPATITRLLGRAGLRPLGLRTLPVPFSFYRATTLSREVLGGGPRIRALRVCFTALAALVYPVARWTGRDNQMVVVAHL